jgi:hypothetical protein
MPPPVSLPNADIFTGNDRLGPFPLQSHDGAAQVQAFPGKPIKGKRFGKARLRHKLHKATGRVVDACIKLTTAAEGRLPKPVHMAVAMAGHVCANVQPLVYREAIVPGSTLVSGAVKHAAPAGHKDKQALDDIVASLKQHKKTFKMARQPIQAAQKRLARMEEKIARRQGEARQNMARNIPDLCVMLPMLRRELERQGPGGTPDMFDKLGRVGQLVGKLAGTRHDAPLKQVAAAVDDLWECARVEARAEAALVDVQSRRNKIHGGGCLETAIDQSRILIDRAVGLRRSASPDPQSFAQAFQGFERTYVLPFLSAKAAADALPKVDEHARSVDLQDAAGPADPSWAMIGQVVTRQAASAMSSLSNQAFDELRVALASGGVVDIKLRCEASGTRSETLIAMRDAVSREWVRRYETEPLSVLAKLTNMLESHADRHMSDSGRPIAEMSLPDDDPKRYEDARKAVNKLLRGMCLSRGSTARADHLSSLLFKSGHAPYRDALMENTAWKDPVLFQALMARILRTEPNEEVMKPQYLRVMQDIQVILNRTALGPAESARTQRTRPLSDFDSLRHPMRGKSRRGVFWRAWDKVKFWSKYLVFKGDRAMERARLEYHHAHVDKQLRAMLDLLSRNHPDPRQIRRAYRRFLEAADDVRVEYKAQQRPDAACRDYLHTEFSRAMGRLGTEAVKNVYVSMQQQCPDTGGSAPRFPALAHMRTRWRNAFYDGQRATPRHQAQWQEMAEKHWAELISTVEQEPEARIYTDRLAQLASKFERDHHKDYAGMKAALDTIIVSDAKPCIGPRADAFSAYDSAWNRIEPTLGIKLMDRLDRYADNMDGFLKFNAGANLIAEENRFMYSYILERLRESGAAAARRYSMNRHTDRRAPAPLIDHPADPLPA